MPCSALRTVDSKKAVSSSEDCMEIERERERERGTHTHTHRQSHRPTDTQTHTETHTHRDTHTHTQRHTDTHTETQAHRHTVRMFFWGGAAFVTLSWLSRQFKIVSGFLSLAHCWRSLSSLASEINSETESQSKESWASKSLMPVQGTLASVNQALKHSQEKETCTLTEYLFRAALAMTAIFRRQAETTSFFAQATDTVNLTLSINSHASCHDIPSPSVCFGGGRWQVECGIPQKQREMRLHAKRAGLGGIEVPSWDLGVRMQNRWCRLLEVRHLRIPWETHRHRHRHTHTYIYIYIHMLWSY